MSISANDLIKLSDVSLDMLASALADYAAARIALSDAEYVRGDAVKALIDAQNKLERVLV
jgi:hypothetical protein